MAKAYEALYENLRPRLADCDLRACALRMGLPAPIGGTIHCDFLGRKYLISRQGVEKTDERPENINSRSVLIHYLLSEGEGWPTGEFVPMSKLTGMVAGGKSHDALFAKPLRGFLGENYQGPLPAAEALGGILSASSKKTEYHWYFQLLPKVPMKLVHYVPDDEYPLEFKYLFDRQAVRILEYECLAFLIGCFNYELIAAHRSAAA